MNLISVARVADGFGGGGGASGTLAAAAIIGFGLRIVPSACAVRPRSRGALV